jgi:hypothetical protein
MKTDVLIATSESAASNRKNWLMDAVKKWLFEPARMGRIVMVVWVLLQVKFELG